MCSEPGSRVVSRGKRQKHSWRLKTKGKVEVVATISELIYGNVKVSHPDWSAEATEGGDYALLCHCFDTVCLMCHLRGSVLSPWLDGVNREEMEVVARAGGDLQGPPGSWQPDHPVGEHC